MNRQSTFFCSVLILCVMMIASSNAQRIQNSQSATRIWSDDSGTFSIEANLLKINSSTVTLRKINDVVIEVPFDRLSKSDRAFIQQNLQAAKKLSQPSEPTAPTTAGQALPAVRPKAEPTIQLSAGTRPTGQISENDIAPYLRESFRSNTGSDSQKIEQLTFPKPNQNYRANGSANAGFGQLKPAAELPKISVIDFGSGGSKEASAAKTPGGSRFGSGSNEDSNSFFTEIPQTKPRIGSNASSKIIDIPANVLDAVPAKSKASIQLIANGVDHRSVRQGLRQLRSVQVPSNAPAVIDAVRLCANSKDSTTRRLVIEYLAAADPQNSINWIFAGINDPSFDVRWISYRTLEKMGDTRVIPELAKRFGGEDRAQIVLVLSKLGGASEPHIIPYLNSETVKVQLSACSLLGQIGGQGSLQSLKNVSTKTETDPKVRLQAQNSIEMIQTRFRSAASAQSQNQLK